MVKLVKIIPGIFIYSLVFQWGCMTPTMEELPTEDVAFDPYVSEVSIQGERIKDPLAKADIPNDTEQIIPKFDLPIKNNQETPISQNSWIIPFRGEGKDYLRNVVVDEDGNVYAAGTFYSLSLKIGYGNSNVPPHTECPGTRKNQP